MKSRKATEADIEYFWELNCSCYREVVYRQFGVWDLGFQRTYFEAKWQEHDFNVVEVDDIPVGGYWVDEHEDFNLLREIQIHPDHQGKGLGTRIIEQVFEQARAAGKPLRLRVLFQNDAVRLYERLGFICIGTNETQYIMERQI